MKYPPVEHHGLRPLPWDFVFKNEFSRPVERLGLRPLRWMLLYVVLFSLLPLIIDLAPDGTNPFLFNLCIVLGQIMGIFLFIAFYAPGLIFNRTVWSTIRQHVMRTTLLFGSLAHIAFAFFSWSTHWVDTAVSTIVFELWPIFFIVFTILFMRRGRYRPPTWLDGVIILLAFSGMVCLVLSTQEPDGNRFGAGPVFGMGLALLAAFSTALNILPVRWGMDLRQSLPESVAPPGVTADRPELVCTMLGFALSCVFSLPLNAGMTFVSVIGGTGGAEFSMTAALLSVLTGVTILPVVVFCFRRANLETDDPRINTVAYATPVLALIWLSLATEITIPHPSLLVIGTAAILAANVLLQTDPESRIAGTARLGFRALVVALWSCGAITLTRDDWFLPDALKWSGSSWWEIQALSTTLFAFLLSFRIARLDNRAQKEDDLAIHILHRLEEARSKEQLGAESVKIFLSVTCRGARADLPAAYARLRTALQKSKTAMGSHVLSSLETQIDMFFWSRQRGRDFGEFVAIVALAVITVTIALLSRPTVNGWVGFLTEIFVMIFCANLIYLVVTLADRRRARFSGLFEQSSMSDNHGIPVALDSEERIGFHSFIALLMSFLVVVAFGYAFFEKWIGL